MTLKVIVGSGWWSGQESPWSLGSPRSRSVDFFNLWHSQVIRCLDPEAIVVTDSNSPIKPEKYRRDRVVWLELDRNYGHANDIRVGAIHTKYSGFTRSVLVGAMYALACDADYYVYVEQDNLLYGDNFIESATLDSEADIYLGDRIENGKGIEGRIAAAFFQQSLMIVKNSGLERFISATLNAPETDGEMSPEKKMERDLSPFGVLSVPYGRSRPIDFSRSHFYAQHLTDIEIEKFLALKQVNAGVFCDAAVLPLDEQKSISARSLKDQKIRTSLHQLITSWNLPDAPSALERSRNTSDRIWVYWEQGFENSPSIVQACSRQLRRVVPERSITFLTSKNIGHYVDIPGYVYDKLFDNPTHFSDLLRVTLLAEHGGIWADATCYITQNILQKFSTLTRSGFFAFSRSRQDQYMLSNWFLCAKPHQPIPALMRDTLLEYWKRKTHLEHYFIFHYFFEANYNYYPEFREQWDLMKVYNAYDPHELQSRLLDPFNDDIFNEIIRRTFVHKLTYKLSERPQNSFLSFIEGL